MIEGIILSSYFDSIKSFLIIFVIQYILLFLASWIILEKKEWFKTLIPSLILPFLYLLNSFWRGFEEFAIIPLMIILIPITIKAIYKCEWKKSILISLIFISSLLLVGLIYWFDQAFLGFL